jgi:hypothetical protein
MNNLEELKKSIEQEYSPKQFYPLIVLSYLDQVFKPGELEFDIAEDGDFYFWVDSNKNLLFGKCSHFGHIPGTTPRLIFRKKIEDTHEKKPNHFFARLRNLFFPERD